MLVCPVCREPLDPESASVSCEVIDDPEDHSFVMTSELKAQQQERAAMFERQKAKGGIIDLEAEKKKFLINQVSCIIVFRDSIQIICNYFNHNLHSTY